MDEERSLTEVEQDIDLRAAALEAYTSHLAALQQQFLVDMREAAWILAREGDESSLVPEVHERVTQRFFSTQLEALNVRLAADLEVVVVQALAGDDIQAHAVQQRADGGRVSSSRMGHASRATLRAVLADGAATHPSNPPTRSVALASDPAFDRLVATARLGAPADNAAAGTYTERIVDALLVEWLTVEHEEARALIDDASARAAMAVHMARSTLAEQGVEPETDPVLADGTTRTPAMMPAAGELRSHLTELLDGLEGLEPGDADAFVSALLERLGSGDATMTPTTAVVQAAWDEQVDDAMVESVDTVESSDEGGNGPGLIDDEHVFEAAFVAFWDSLPVATRHAMVADRGDRNSLTLVDAPVDRDEVTNAVDHAPIVVQPVVAPVLHRSLRQRLAPSMRTVAFGLRPVVGITAAVVFTMAVIG